MVYDTLSLRLGHAVDSEARVYLQTSRAAQIASMSGRLRGPQCDFAHTLKSEHPVQQLSGSADPNCLAEVLITDPCYWTPQLPFQYELHVDLQLASGETRELTTSMGLHRWGAEGPNLRLERRRTVLRGAQVTREAFEAVSTARDAEVALLVETPSEELCHAASRLGVPLVVDLRSCEDPLGEERQRLAWSPAVLIALLTPGQLGDALKTSFLLAQSITTGTTEQEATAIECDLYAIHLGPNDSPPAWLAHSDKPVIAIRHGKTYAEGTEARAACDGLQRELAPQFDFAGYFVAL